MGLGDVVTDRGVEFVIVCDGSGVLPGIAIVGRPLGASSLSSVVKVGHGANVEPIDRYGRNGYGYARRRHEESPQR